MQKIYKFTTENIIFIFGKEDGKWYVDFTVRGEIPGTLLECKEKFASDLINEYFNFGEITQINFYAPMFSRLKRSIRPEEWVKAYDEEIYFCEVNNPEKECSCPLCDKTRGQWSKIKEGDRNA